MNPGVDAASIIVSLIAAKSGVTIGSRRPRGEPDHGANIVDPHRLARSARDPGPASLHFWWRPVDMFHLAQDF